MLKLIECETLYVVVANTGIIAEYLIERAIGKSQTLETGLQTASGLSKLGLRRPATERFILGCTQTEKGISPLSQLGEGELGCRRTHK